MESPTTSHIFLLLTLCFVTILCTDGPTQCTTGSRCFPYGPMPKKVTNKLEDYYCCLDRNRSKHADKIADGTLHCSCMLNLTMEQRIQEISRESRHRGRMCLREKDCEGADSTSVHGYRFKFCCFRDTLNFKVHSSIYMYSHDVDADKEEYLLCRCGNTQVPTPKPKAYVVPPVPSFNSTGEVCSYDEGCKSRPSLKCESVRKDVTFCCYGSRGLVTQNDGNNFTRCTCTDEVYGKRCTALPIAISDSTTPCLSECSNRTAEDTCTDSSQDVRCCPYNMAVVASQSDDGNFTSCTCTAQAKKSCGGETSFTTRCSSHVTDVIFPMLAVFLLGHIWP